MRSQATELACPWPHSKHGPGSGVLGPHPALWGLVGSNQSPRAELGGTLTWLCLRSSLAPPRIHWRGGGGACAHPPYGWAQPWLLPFCNPGLMDPIGRGPISFQPRFTSMRVSPGAYKPLLKGAPHAPAPACDLELLTRPRLALPRGLLGHGPLRRRRASPTHSLRGL